MKEEYIKTDGNEGKINCYIAEGHVGIMTKQAISDGNDEGMSKQIITG